VDSVKGGCGHRHPEFDGSSAAGRGPPRWRRDGTDILVLDLVCVLGIGVLGAVVALVGKAVEKL
jgi:hypothetical protein